MRETVAQAGLEFIGLAVAPDVMHRFALRFPAIGLLPGKYTVRTHAMDPEGMRLCDTFELPLFVEGDTRELGLCRLPHEWLTV